MFFKKVGSIHTKLERKTIHCLVLIFDLLSWKSFPLKHARFDYIKLVCGQMLVKPKIARHLKITQSQIKIENSVHLVVRLTQVTSLTSFNTLIIDGKLEFLYLLLLHLIGENLFTFLRFLTFVFSYFNIQDLNLLDLISFSPKLSNNDFLLLLIRVILYSLHVDL